jgi:hypothetical protein
MEKKLLFVGILIITIATFLEISFYFFYIFKPIDRLMGRDLEMPRDIPMASDIFTKASVSRYILQADEAKKIYSDRVNSFIDETEEIAKDDSSFLKIVEADYVLGGNVENINPIQEDGNQTNISYDLSLGNSRGQKYSLHLSSSELRYAKIYLKEEISKNNLGVEESDFNVQVGDYLTLKRTTNLLNPAEVKTVIEIFKKK